MNPICVIFVAVFVSAPVHQSVFFKEDFSSLSSTAWGVELQGWSMLQIRSNEVRLENRPYLVSKTDLPSTEYLLSLAWAWEEQTAEPKDADELSLVLRTTGKVQQHFPYHPMDGLRIRIHAGTGKIALEGITDGTVTILKEGNLPQGGFYALPPVDWHGVVLIDTGHKIVVEVGGKIVLDGEYDPANFKGTKFALSNGASLGPDQGDILKASYVRGLRIRVKNERT